MLPLCSCFLNCHSYSMLHKSRSSICSCCFSYSFSTCFLLAMFSGSFQSCFEKLCWGTPSYFIPSSQLPRYIFFTQVYSLQSWVSWPRLRQSLNLPFTEFTSPPFSQDVISFAKMCVCARVCGGRVWFFQKICAVDLIFVQYCPDCSLEGGAKWQLQCIDFFFLPSMCSILMQKTLLEVLKLLWLPF